MALTWNRRSRRVKERKRDKLLVAQKKVVNKKKEVEHRIELIQEEVKKERAIAVEARKQETTASTHLARAKSKGVDPFPKHVEMHKEAAKIAKSANTRETAALKRLTTVKAEVPVVPEVPAVASIGLSKSDIASIALFVLLDVLHLNKWVALAIVSAGAAAFYFAEKQGWTDFLNF